MRSYNVISPVTHDGRPHPIGSTIELDDATAAPLLAVRAIAAPEIAERALSDILTGSDYLPMIIRVTEAISIPQKEIVERAFVASGLDHAGWNGLSDDDRELRIASSVELVRAQYRDPLLANAGGGPGIQAAQAEAARVERENLSPDPTLPAAEAVVASKTEGFMDPVLGTDVVAGDPVIEGTVAAGAPAVVLDPVAATHTHTEQDGQRTGGRRRT